MPWEINCSSGGCYVTNKNTGRRMNKKPMSEVAAKRFLRALYANVTEKTHTSAMIALPIPLSVAEGLTELSRGVFGDLADISRVPPDEMHITLIYLGPVEDLSSEVQAKIHQTVGAFGIDWYDKYNGEPLVADVHGVGRFNHVGDDQSALVYLVNGPLLGCLRECLRMDLEGEGVISPSEYGFIPHITIGYLPSSTLVGAASFPSLAPLEFTEMAICLGDQQMSHKFAASEGSAMTVTKEISGDNQPNRNVEAAVQTLLEEYGWSTENIATVIQAVETAVNRSNLTDPEPQAFTVKSGEEGSLFVYKASDGHYRWVMTSSNGFEDRDGECVSVKALEEDCLRADELAKSIGWKAYGPLTFWHQEEAEFERLGDWTSVKAGDSSWAVGKCDFNAVINGMLVESGTFFDETVAESLIPVMKTLRVSIAFARPPGSPDRERVYHQIRRYARTLVPLGHAVPSNRFTSVRIEGVNHG